MILPGLILTDCPEPDSGDDSVSYALGDTGPAGGLIFYYEDIYLKSYANMIELKEGIKKNWMKQHSKIYRLVILSNCT